MSGTTFHTPISSTAISIISAGVLHTVDLTSRSEDKSDDIGIDYKCVLPEPDSNSIIMFYKNIALVYNKNDFPTAVLTPPEQ